MSTGVVFALVVREMLQSGVPLKWKHFLCIFSHVHKYFISIAHDLWRLMVLFAMPTAVALSQCIGILGWGCPRSSRVVLNIIPSWQFINNAPSSASAANATTYIKIAHNVWKAPYSLIGLPSLGSDPMKKMAACLATSFWFTQIWCVGMDVQLHIWCSKSHHRIPVRCKVIKDLVCFFQGKFCSFCLLTCNWTQRH